MCSAHESQDALNHAAKLPVSRYGSGSGDGRETDSSSLSPRNDVSQDHLGQSRSSFSRRSDADEVGIYLSVAFYHGLLRSVVRSRCSSLGDEATGMP